MVWYSHLLKNFPQFVVIHNLFVIPWLLQGRNDGFIVGSVGLVSKKKDTSFFFHNCMVISSLCVKGNFRKPEDLLTQRQVTVLNKVGSLSL